MTALETADLQVGSEVIHHHQHAFVSKIVGEEALICLTEEGAFRLVSTQDLTILP